MNSAPAGGTPYRRGLAGLLCLAALSQLLVQTQAFSSNPLVLHPQSDAAYIWGRAGEIAGGDLVADGPFQTAPLVLWIAAAVRALSGGLVAFGALQSVLYVCVVGLIATSTRSLALRMTRADAGCRTLETGSRELGAGTTGLIGGALFLLLTGPAASTSRVLAGTTQLFLIALLLLVAIAGVRRFDTWRRAILLGALTGLVCLAYPPFLLAVPLAAWIAAAQTRGKRVAAFAVCALTSVLTVAPATVHNYAASSEFVPISAQAGLTLYHGNNAQAHGVIATTGVANAKVHQAADARARAEAALGRELGWAGTSAYWRGQALEWWAEHPVAGVRLLGKKLWLTLSARRYGDVHQPWRERSVGVASRLWLAPVPLAWILFAALVSLPIVLKAWRAAPAEELAEPAVPAVSAGPAGPDGRVGSAAASCDRSKFIALAFLLGLPVLTCLVFFYSPRYRMPIAIAAVPLTALGIQLGTRSRAAALAVWVSLLVGVGAGHLNRAIGVDSDPGDAMAAKHFEALAAASGALGRHDDGARHLAELVRLRPADTGVRLRLATLHWALRHDPAAALAVLEEAPLPERPDKAEAPGEQAIDIRVAIAWLLATGDDEGIADPERALQIVGSLPELNGSTADVQSLRAAALARAGRFDEAIDTATAALADIDVKTPPGTVDRRRADLQRSLDLYRTGEPFLRFRRP